MNTGRSSVVSFVFFLFAMQATFMPTGGSADTEIQTIALVRWRPRAPTEENR
jgi:hypothetical protein